MGVVESANPRQEVDLDNVVHAFLVHSKLNDRMFSVIIQTDSELIALEVTNCAPGAKSYNNRVIQSAKNQNGKSMLIKQRDTIQQMMDKEHD